MKLEIPALSDRDVENNNFPLYFFKKAKELQCFESREEQNKYEQIVTNLFFKGGTIPTGRGDDEYLLRGLRMFKCIIGSWAPSHESKTLVCAVLLKCMS